MMSVKNKKAKIICFLRAAALPGARDGSVGEKGFFDVL